jgi:hypothetical protein
MSKVPYGTQFLNNHQYVKLWFSPKGWSFGGLLGHSKGGPTCHLKWKSDKCNAKFGDGDQHAPHGLHAPTTLLMAFSINHTNFNKNAISFYSWWIFLSAMYIQILVFEEYWCLCPW